MTHRLFSLLKLPVFMITVLCMTVICAQDPEPTPKPKSDRDKCETDKDHTACKKYYRANCLAKDPEACKSYAKELMIDCGEQPKPDASGETVHQYLQCARKSQCWHDRSYSIMQLNEVCKADPEGVTCKEVKDRFITAKSCDEPQVNVF